MKESAIFCSFSIHTALLSELIYKKLLLNVLSEQIYKIIFRGFSGKEIAPFQLSWQGVTLALEQNRIVFYYTAMVNSSYPGIYPGLLRGKFSDSSETDLIENTDALMADSNNFDSDSEV